MNQMLTRYTHYSNNTAPCSKFGASLTCYISKSGMKHYQLIPIFPIFLATCGFASNFGKVEPRIFKILATSPNSTVNIIISFNPSTSSLLAKLKTKEFPTRIARASAVVKALKSHAAKYQRDTVKLLNNCGIDYKILWITNQISVRAATASLITNLEKVSTIKQIRESSHLKFTAKPGHTIPDRFSATATTAEWGLEYMNVPQAWSLLPGGNMGENVIIGEIYTGVHYTHVDLIDNWVGPEYGWFDVTTPSSMTPVDEIGLGTATMSCITGRIGVAPRARWMACRALRSMGDIPMGDDFLLCAQWVMEPSLPDGTGQNVTKMPHVVSIPQNADTNEDDYFDDMLRAWHAVGIIPVASAGTILEDNDCDSVLSPGDSIAGVITVGSTTILNEVADFSARGSTWDLRIKPEFVAPGVTIRVASINPNNIGYVHSFGTDLSSAYVTGVIALLKSYKPDLTFDEVILLLNQTAVRDTLAPTPGEDCGNVPSEDTPNNVVGWGLVNALASLEALIDLYPVPTTTIIPPSTTSTSTTSRPSTTTRRPTTSTTTTFPPFHQIVYPCKKDGFFAISTTIDKSRYCPAVHKGKCDFVLCTWYDIYNVFVRVFYRCPQDTVMPNLNGDYELNEIIQKCVRIS